LGAISPCLSCPQGAKCLGGTTIPIAIPGFWEVNAIEWTQRGMGPPALTPGIPSFVECPYPEGCLGGKAVFETTNSQEIICAKGRQGFMCSDCSSGFGGAPNTLAISVKLHRIALSFP
jgi:hypothetical protein